MLLVVDIGNSNITLGSYKGEKLDFVARIATDRKKTGDQYAIELRDILHLYKVSSADVSGAIVSTVVPALGKAFVSAIEKLTGKKPLLVGPGVKTGLQIKIDNPAQLGADLVTGAVAGKTLYKMPCIILDMGTATTLSVLDKEGAFLGGPICAGVGISLEALTTKTAQLPDISIDAPKNVIGTNTVDCMKSGLVFGTASMIDGMIDRIEDELGEQANIVATGGLSPEIIKHCKHKIEYCDNLLLEGLRLIYEKNHR